MRHSHALLLTVMMMVALDACGPDGGSSGPSDPKSPAWTTREDTIPKVSPDGRQIAFVSERDGNSDIYVVDVDGKNERRLTTSPDLDLDPAWSPDGRRIAFDSDPNGYPELFMMNADGSDLHRVDGAPPWVVFPAFSPDGRRLAFASGGYFEGLDIYVMDLETGELDQLTDTPDAIEWEPAWSPNGQSIAFASDEEDPQFDLAIMDDDGSDRRALTARRGREADPVFNTGAELLFDATDQNGDSRICYLNIWSPELPLTKRIDCIGLMTGETPSIVPGDELLVFAGHVPGEGLRVFTVTDGGDPPQRIT